MLEDIRLRKVACDSENVGRSRWAPDFVGTLHGECCQCNPVLSNKSLILSFTCGKALAALKNAFDSYY
jgi:hypothetical protein